MSLNLSDKLFDILSHSIDWVKYAESKNAALIVLNTLVVVRLIFQINQFNDINKIIFLFSLFMFFLSIIICCVSFIPVVNYKSLNSHHTTQTPTEKLYDLLVKKDDLIYSPKQWLELYCNLHEIDHSIIRKIDIAYAEQILIQKKIRFRKYKLFNISLFCLISGFFLLFIAAYAQYF
tara:strand:+ start:371 stop:901 length:531 start_codon:yes stop_codon:yes gene_type:complete